MNYTRLPSFRLSSFILFPHCALEIKSKASKVLAQLLQLEYKNLNNTAKLNPTTKALTEVFTKVDKQSNIVIISHRNHDAEALAFNTFSFARKGNAVITV